MRVIIYVSRPIPSVHRNLAHPRTRHPNRGSGMTNISTLAMTVVNQGRDAEDTIEQGSEAEALVIPNECDRWQWVEADGTDHEGHHKNDAVVTVTKS